VAEFWNTLSNASFLIYALCGLQLCWRWRLERRFWASFGTLAMVGAGSWAFHQTLLYEMQLMDELPMLYCAACILYCGVESGRDTRYGWRLALGLAVYVMVSTVVYVVVKLPVIHHVAYGEYRLRCISQITL
jgi:dihydroceramidase